MAMEYTRVYFSFVGRGKGALLEQILGGTGCWCIVKLWTYANERYPDGLLPMNAIKIERVCAGWPGEKGKFIDILLDLELIDKLNENLYQLHGWFKNNPHNEPVARRKRSDKAKKAAEARWNATEHKDNATEHENDAQGMLGDANVTKRNVTELNVKKKTSKKESPAQKVTNSLIDRILNFWKEEAGKKKLSILTKIYRTQTKGRIDQLKAEKGIREEEDIFQAFVYVIRNKKKQADDDNYSRFTPPDWNISTLTRNRNFMKYLDEAEYVPILTKKQKADIADKEWANEESD